MNVMCSFLLDVDYVFDIFVLNVGFGFLGLCEDIFVDSVID